MAINIVEQGLPQPTPTSKMYGRCQDCYTKIECLYSDVTHHNNGDNLIRCPNCTMQWIQLFFRDTETFDYTVYVVILYLILVAVVGIVCYVLN